ncbi:MAG: hypothetical protein ACKVT0_20270 [Planctomycetaceae bacterium]
MRADQKAAKKAIEMLCGTSLFQHVGEAFDSTQPGSKFERAKSWKAAIAFTKKEKFWLYAGTEAGNELSMTIHTAWGNKFLDETNKLVRNFNKRLSIPLNDLVEADILAEIGNGADAVLKKIVYDFRSIALDYAYAELLPISYFRTVIEPLYLAGRFPCGWNGKKAVHGIKGLLRSKAEVVF